MLRTRVITALCLLAGLLPAVFLLPAWGWMILVAAVAGLAGWELGRLAGFAAAASVAFGVGIAGLCLAYAFGVDSTAADRAVLTVSAAVWLLAAPLWLRRRWPLRPAGLALVVGLIVILPTWLALVLLWKVGPATLFGTMALVWIADIAAYFTGRRFGRRKLAPNISPGKTWEGAWGAIAGVLIYGLAVFAAGALPSLPLGLVLVALPILTLVSIEGDLFESLLKRQAGFKDSSGLLPGHGGVLDRIDSLTSTLPIAALLLIR